MIGCDNGSDPGPGPGPGGDGFVVPTDWVRFTEAEMLAAKFYVGLGGENPDTTSITKNADESYTVKLQTVTDTEYRQSVVWVNFADVDGEPRVIFRNGTYAHLTLPTTGGSIRPVNVAVIPVRKGGTGTIDVAWDSSNDATLTGDLPATMDGLYVVGDLRIHWGTDLPKTDNFAGLAIYFMWAPEAVTANGEDYTFTIKDLAVLPHDTSIVDPDPDDLIPETPPAKPEPSGYVAFPGSSEALRATYYPWNADNKIEGNTVTVVAPAGGRTLVRLLGTDVKWKKGYYLSVTLPNNANKPQKIYSLGTKTDTSDGEWAVSDLVEASSGKFLAGRVDFAAVGEDESVIYTGVMLDIYWHGGQEEAMYTFTINAIKVAETSTEAPPAEKPGIHETSQLADATYALNATVTPLKIVPNWTDNSANYDYEWWKAESVDATWPAVGVQWWGDSFTPPTDVAGTFYYYGVVIFGSEKTTTRIVTITVN